MKVLLIIPAYNEQENIEKTVKTITNYSKDIDYIVINDGSKDNTPKILDEKNINHIDLVNNLGIGGAVQTGYKYAYENNYDIAIQFDGDGQHQAKYLKQLVKEIEKNNADVVIGSRFVTEKKPKSMRMFGSNLLSFAIFLVTGKKIKDPTSGMRAYNKKAIEAFVKNASLTPEPDTIVYMLKKKMKIKEVQVKMKEREFGESYLKPIKAMEYMINM